MNYNNKCNGCDNSMVNTNTIKTIVLCIIFSILGIYITYMSFVGYYNYVTVVNNYYLQEYYYYYIQTITEVYKQVIEYEYTRDVLLYYAKTINKIEQQFWAYDIWGVLHYLSSKTYSTASDWVLASQKIGDWVLYGTTDTGEVLVNRILSDPELVEILTPEMEYLGYDLTHYAVRNVFYVLTIFGYRLEFTTFVIEIFLMIPVLVVGIITRNKYLIIFSITAITLAIIWQYYLYLPQHTQEWLYNTFIKPITNMLENITSKLW